MLAWLAPAKSRIERLLSSWMDEKNWSRPLLGRFWGGPGTLVFFPAECREGAAVSVFQRSLSKKRLFSGGGDETRLAFQIACHRRTRTRGSGRAGCGRRCARGGRLGDNRSRLGLWPYNIDAALEVRTIFD